jgi:hypothetical protein
MKRGYGTKGGLKRTNRGERIKADNNKDEDNGVQKAEDKKKRAKKKTKELELNCFPVSGSNTGRFLNGSDPDPPFTFLKASSP